MHSSSYLDLLGCWLLYVCCSGGKGPAFAFEAGRSFLYLTNDLSALATIYWLEIQRFSFSLLKILALMIYR